MLLLEYYMERRVKPLIQLVDPNTPTTCLGGLLPNGYGTATTIHEFMGLSGLYYQHGVN